ncbi:MAG: hypothetical protein JO255_08930 [Alphaproteobacteria bacterium]|nr:hypothetical protein [Alphaproteobacteria bacterium]
MVIQFTPRSLLSVVFRHYRKITVIFLLCVGGAVAFNTFAPQYFEPKSSMLVKFGKDATVYRSDDNKNTSSDTTPLDRKEIVNSQIKILESHGLISKVLNEIGVGTIYPDLISDPPTRGTPLDAAIDRFGSNLTVNNPRDTNVIEVSLLDEDAGVGTRAVNLLVNRFIERDLKLFGDPQSTFLQAQLDVFRDQVSKAQQAVAQFKIDNHISSIDEERTMLLKQRTDLDTTLKGVEAHVAEVTSKKEGLTTALNNTKPDVELYSESDRYRSIDDAKQKLLELQSRLQNLLSYYTENAPPVIATKEEIARVKQSLADEEKTIKARTRTGKNEVYQQIQVDLLRNDAELKSSQASADEMHRQLAEVTKRIQGLDEKQAQLQDLALQLEVAENNYKTYMERSEDARIAEDLNKQKITSISVIEPATQPVKPARPRFLLNLALGVLLGGFLGLMAAFLSEAFDDAYSTPEQVERSIGAPVLVSIAEARRRGAA